MMEVEGERILYPFSVNRRPRHLIVQNNHFLTFLFSLKPELMCGSLKNMSGRNCQMSLIGRLSHSLGPAHTGIMVRSVISGILMAVPTPSF